MSGLTRREAARLKTLDEITQGCTLTAVLSTTSGAVALLADAPYSAAILFLLATAMLTARIVAVRGMDRIIYRKLAETLAPDTPAPALSPAGHVLPHGVADAEGRR